jgi:hypothetical protein
MKRRSAITGAGTVLSMLLAGCSGDADSKFDPDVEPVERLGAGSPVAIEAEPEHEYEYLAESNSVHVEYKYGDSETMPFADWGTRRAAVHAADHVHTLLRKESLIGTAISVDHGEAILTELDRTSTDDSPPNPALNRAVPVAPIVFHKHTYNRDGKITIEPSVSFQTIVNATPRTIDVTMLFPEREYSTILPVVCKRTVRQYA